MQNNELSEKEIASRENNEMQDSNEIVNEKILGKNLKEDYKLYGDGEGSGSPIGNGGPLIGTDGAADEAEHVSRGRSI